MNEVESGFFRRDFRWELSLVNILILVLSVEYSEVYYDLYNCEVMDGCGFKLLKLC